MIKLNHQFNKFCISKILYYTLHNIILNKFIFDWLILLKLNKFQIFANFI